MKKRVIAIVAATAFAVSALGAPVLADASDNGHNCVGASASSANPPGFGPEVASIAKSGPGAVAALIATIRAEGCGNGAT